ncbi:MAG: TIGR00296 family protein [Candidatus Thermoplasmatota archaeon]|nr:TIGR00296 family protein [Candidatus Thermoplasmatota archaeon]
MFNKEDGELAVRAARAHIERKLGRKDAVLPDPTPVFGKESGVFVTLNTYPGRELRGCIGYPEPIMELGKALKDAAISAATRDPRFPTVRQEEMERIVIDVTLLTPPVDIQYGSTLDLISQIKIGRDGLIARRSGFSGLLLPQVPVEYGWTVEEFLSHTCMKAGLHLEEWRRENVMFQKFQGRVFGEQTPGGEVEEIPLG